MATARPAPQPTGPSARGRGLGVAPSPGRGRTRRPLTSVRPHLARAAGSPESRRLSPPSPSPGHGRRRHPPASAWWRHYCARLTPKQTWASTGRKRGGACGRGRSPSACQSTCSRRGRALFEGCVYWRLDTAGEQLMDGKVLGQIMTERNGKKKKKSRF